MKNVLPGAGSLLLALGFMALSGCEKDTSPPVGPVTVPQTVNLQLGMTGYLSEPNTVARFGIATTRDDAQKGRGTLLTGKINYTDTKGGKESKAFTLANQTKGTTHWVYVSTAKKPATNQTITLNWNVSDALVLSASSADTLVVKELVVQ